MACYSLKPINNFWKLDKIDKIGISIILVFFAIFSIFDCFCFASSQLQVPYTTLSGYTWREGKIVEDSLYDIRVWQLDTKQNYYLISNNSQQGRVVRLSNTIENNLSLLQEYYVFPGDKILVDLSDFSSYSQLYLSFPYRNSQEGIEMFSNIFLYYENTSSGMNNTVSSLVDNVGIFQLWSIFETSIPYIYIVVIVAIGIYFIFHAIREMSKGRDI